jgi:aspartyl-tRNA(Asn)/glutamyl-tRNA(Gln) amidotransferase subunit B
MIKALRGNKQENDVTEYEPIIGLEIHAQLLTRTKLFCACPATYGAEPNTLICPVCLGLPGALPVVNERAVELAIRMGIAMDCDIASHSQFARKNYFYPDCPKNYQITQYENPLCTAGHLVLRTNGRKVRIKRIHLEEDAGKLVHPVEEDDSSYVDMNRAGTPLIEIVTEPDIRAPSDASLVAQELRLILRHLNICDGNMEEGSLRCDVNVSLRKQGTEALGVKTEIKNVNSFKAIEHALESEIARQEARLRRGAVIEHATLLWDAVSQKCHVMRSKEEAHDYRYFPEPDLNVLDVPCTLVESVREGLPELPRAMAERFVEEYGIPRYDAELLTGSKETARYFEQTARQCSDSKTASNWVMREVLGELNERRIEIGEFAVSADQLARLIRMVESGAVSMATAKDVFKEMAATGSDAASIITAKGLQQIGDDAELDAIINAVLDDNPEAVAECLAGKEKLFKWLVGQTMQASQGRADPMRATERLNALVEKRRGDG